MNSGLQTPCNASPATATSATPAAHPRLTLAATILASSLAFIDGSVVNVALPAIGHSLDATAADLQWAVNAYLLPLSALLLLGGAIGDRFGRKRMLVTGIAVFALASLACAVAPSLDLLLAARVAQGVGAAMLMPNSLAILGSAFTGEQRGRAVGTWAAAGAIAGAVGPPLGGWLVDSIGWRAIFLLNLPLAAAAIVIAWRYVGESRDPGNARLDWLGAALVTASLGAATWGLTLASTAGLTSVAGAAVGAGAVLMLGFLWVEHRRGEAAMMPLSLFGSASFVGLTLLTLFLYGALGGLLVLLPYVLIKAAGYTALAAGAALLPFPAVIAVASRTMGRLAERMGPRLPLTVGPLVVAVGFALLTRIDAGGDYWTTVLPAILVIAVGMAGAVAPLTTAVLASVDAHHTGTASGFNSAVARTGGLVVTALVGGVIGSMGEALVAGFHIAAWAGAGLALAAALSAGVLLHGAALISNPDTPT